MKRLLLHVHMLVLHCASCLAPREERGEWLREWKAELWHIASRYENAASRAFVAGAFRDAYILRAECRRDGLHRDSRRRSQAVRSSPMLCLFSLLLAGTVAMVLAYLLPGARKTVLPSSYHEGRTLVFVTRDGASAGVTPSVSLGEFRDWQRTAQKVFSDTAFYQIVRKPLHLGHGVSEEISVVRASGNLLSILQSSDFPLPSQSKGARLILSDEMWRRSFHADPQIVGRVVFFMGQRTVIAGVAKPAAWRLPGKADAWMLEDGCCMERLAASTKGFVLARIQPGLARNVAQNSWHMTALQKNGTIAGYSCVSLDRYAREPFGVFEFAMMLALLALPATTSLPLGEYPYNPRQQPLTLRLRRWIFFLAKLALVLPVVGFASLDLAQAFPDGQSAQLILTFAMALAALRWTLRDQRRRCPVCLHLLRNPVHVGQPSRNFLAWNGTELICVVGHGFLHVPELPTSWFSTQRWLYLDPSWKSLFQSPETV